MTMGHRQLCTVTVTTWSNGWLVEEISPRQGPRTSILHAYTVCGASLDVGYTRISFTPGCTAEPPAEVPAANPCERCSSINLLMQMQSASVTNNRLRACPPGSLNHSISFSIITIETCCMRRAMGSRNKKPSCCWDGPPLSWRIYLTVSIGLIEKNSKLKFRVNLGRYGHYRRPTVFETLL